MLLSQTSTNTKFQKPTKNETGYYVSKLEEPIVLTLPKMEIHGNGKNDKGQYEIRYILDINNNNFKELIENLYNLDEFALETAYQNSKEWFGQEISKDILENLYITPYEDEDDSLFIRLAIEDETLLTKFNYEHHCVVEIKSLEFYRNSFKFVMVVKDVIIEEQESEEVVETKNVSLNFNELIESKIDNKMEELLEKENPEEMVSESKQQEQLEDYKTQIIEDSSLTTQNIIDENATQFVDTYSELSKQDVVSIISTKREESRRCFLNAERANRAANNLKKKALETADELKRYEKILENFN